MLLSIPPILIPLVPLDDSSSPMDCSPMITPKVLSWTPVVFADEIADEIESVRLWLQNTSLYL
jgi:hypothetical protein